MRPYGLALLGALLAGAALAQQPPAADQEQLGRVLAAWEKAMGAVETLAADCVRTEVNKTFGYTDTFTGAARYMKLKTGDRVSNLALLHMEKKGKPEVYERFVCTGEFLYQYVPHQKQIRVHQLPPPKPGQVSDDSFLGFLFGMRAEEALKRYNITLQMPTDPNYHYLLVKPLNPRDKADFQQARLVLNKQTLLPRQLWFEQPNGDHVTWDIPKIQQGAEIDRKLFQAPDKPAGWEIIKVEKKNTEAQPRIVRPQQP
jgi:TIGR03009 family protein